MLWGEEHQLPAHPLVLLRRGLRLGYHHALGFLGLCFSGLCFSASALHSRLLFQTCASAAAKWELLFKTGITSRFGSWCPGASLHLQGKMLQVLSQLSLGAHWLLWDRV